GIGQPPSKQLRAPTQLSLYRTGDPRLLQANRIQDAVGELQYAARGGRGKERLYGRDADAVGTDMGDLLADMGPLMYLDYLSRSGRGRARASLGRQID